MKIINYSFLVNGLIQIHLTGNRVVWVRRDENSGQIVTRRKNPTLSNVQHTGIWLGVDTQTGQPLILHNHYGVGTVHITSYHDYAYGQTVYLQGGRCTNPPSRVLEIALAEAKAGTPYSVLLYNCQHLTNRACHNRHHSEDLAKWGMGFFGVACVVLIARALG